MAHGSRADDANIAHLQLCEAVAARTGRTVYPAFLEIATPDVAAAIAAAVSAGHHHISVLPHFLAPGNHTVRDIPELVNAARLEHPAVELEVLPHTGADPGLVALVADAVATRPD